VELVAENLLLRQGGWGKESEKGAVRAREQAAAKMWGSAGGGSETRWLLQMLPQPSCAFSGCSADAAARL
jgi:hypothetical protein